MTHPQASRPWSRLLLDLVFALGLLLTACEEPIDLSVRSIESKVVIDAIITNDTGAQVIRITRSVDYFSPNSFPGVSGATVILWDDFGNRDTLREDSIGVYVTNPANFRTQENRTYYLKVLLDGQTYTAKTHLPYMVPLDTVTWEFTKRPPEFLEGYYITAIGQDPDTIGNFYRFKFYKNDSLHNGRLDLIYAEDKLFNGNTLVLNAPYRLDQQDVIKLELVTFDQRTYNFYEQIQFQLFAGSPFAPPGDNVSTNIEGGAIGFFSGHSIYRTQVIIQ